MNKDRTLQLLRERFDNLTEAGPDVVRAERRYKGKPIGVFYIDFSEAVARPGFNLQAYAQEQIASDFYKHEGSLQWNYYLYFVLEKAAFERVSSTPIVAEVESDRTFARKRIWEQEALNAELAQPLTVTLDSTAPSQDIASRWVEALNNAGLGRIAEPSAAYSSVVEDFLSGASQKQKITASSTDRSVPDGEIIHQLHLDDFREKPARGSYEFGTVNLIRGVNGTGKTSLLEAIELCICGANRRQQGKRPRLAKLRIQYANKSQPERSPETSTQGYRARDLAWYGGYYKTGNQLCYNFGRFNFFDSDAAYQLSSANANGKDIVAAINGLLLGELATTIEERMLQFQTRFGREERALQQLVQRRKQEADNATQQIEQLKTIKDTREALLQELQAKAKACGWQKLPARLKLDDLTILHERVKGTAAQISQSVKELKWLAGISFVSLRRESNQLAATLKNSSDQKDLRKKNADAWEKTKRKIVEVQTELETLRRLREYHAEPVSLSLIGISVAIKETKSKVAQFKEALSLLRGVNFKKFEEYLGTLKEITAQQDVELSKARRNLGKLKERASELQKQLGMINSVIEEIKGLGQRYCELSPHSTDCPLCGAHYDELSAQIMSLEVSASTGSALTKIVNEIAREQAIVDEIQKGTEALTQLRHAAQIVLSKDQLASRSTKSVVESLASLSKKNLAENTKLSELTAKEKRLKMAGFEEEELQELFEVAQENHSLSRSKLEQKAEVQTLVIERSKTLDALRKDANEKEKTQKEIDATIRRIVKDALGEVVVETSDVTLERRKMLVDEVLADVVKVSKAVLVSDSEDFSSVSKRLDTFASAVGRIQKAIKSVEEKDALEEQLAANLTEAEGELAKLKPRHSRAKKAQTVLESLLGSDYKEAYRQQVVREHKEKLSTIFSRIHAPHEFKDVVIDTEVLLERDNGVKSTVYEISTGQRAALALSIFLSLNSGVGTRAPWLLFDDPVVYVDDLNVLSFLDMLRDLVLLDTRQVFFATANTRIADLFAKKFDFLGTDFREFSFQR